MGNSFGIYGIVGLALGVAATASASVPTPIVVQEASNGYNSWPIVQAIGTKVVCAYSRGTAHNISQGVRGVYARVSSDGGATWGDEVTVANDATCGEVAIGKGMDANGAMLLWVRCWGGTSPHHDLYRTTDGISFEKIATPALDPVPMQITDIFAVPGVGLMCLWFSDGYASSSVRSWGKLVSADNGHSWTRTTVETGLVTGEWPTEPSGVWLGDGRILVIARCEGTDRQFQIVSTDSGATWTKMRTNITDVRMSTPSLVYDATRGLVSNYYYQRGAKMLKRRVAPAADVFGHPDQWPQPELLYTGEETVAIDAGNVNVTVKSDGAHLAATYTGTSSNTKVVALSVAPPTRAGIAPGSVLLPPVKCYSQRGLVLHLDGRENVGAGLEFDPDATVWKDLSSSGNDANLTANGDFEVGEFGLQMKIANQSVWFAAVTKGDLTAGMTAECLVKPTGSDSGVISTVWGGGGSNGDNIPMARARLKADSFCFDDETKKWTTGVALGSVYQFSIRSTDGITWTGCNDGVATAASYAPGEKLASAPLALGGFTGWPRRLTGTIYAMRVYDRPLHELEMKANAIIDHIRFEGASPMTAAWPDGFRYDPENGEVLVRVQIQAQRGLLVSLNGGDPVASIDEWLVRGTPYEARVVSDGGEFEKWTDSADGLTEEESTLSTLALYADLPRQLIASPRIILPPVKCYSQRGLVLHLDGRENVGAGLDFDPDTTVWKDLSSSSNDANLTVNGDFADGEFGLQMKIANQSVWFAAVTKGDLTAGMTAECLVKPTGSDSGVISTVWGGGGSNGDNIPMARARFTSSATEGNFFSFDGGDMRWKTGVELGSVYQFSIRSTDGITWTGCNDGVATAASYAPGENLASAPLALGGFTGWPRRLTGTIYAMRVYDRPLHELEMKANAIIDHIRFEGANPMTAAWPDGFRYDLNGEIKVRVQLLARKGLLVSLNGGKPSSSIDEWLVRGTPYEVTVVSDGEQFEKWVDSVEELTEAESRSTTLELYADMPRELVAMSEGWMPSAGSCSQRGLVLHLDGRENVGAGLDFDPDTTVWKDLSSSSNDANLTVNGDFEVGEFGLQMKIADQNVWFAAVTKGDLTAGMTAECLVKPTGRDSGMFATVWGGGGSNGDNIPLARARFSSDAKASNFFSFDDSDIKWKTGVVLGDTYQISLRSTDGITWTGCNDGVATAASYAPGEKLASAPLALGGFTGWPRRLTGTIYAMRVYDRPLHEDEMKANAIIDHIRFEGASPMTAAWPDGFRYDLQTGNVMVHVRLSARRGLLISLNGGEPVASIDEWMARGTPYEVAVVSDGEQFEMWMDSAEELTEAESRSATLKLYADMPRVLVANEHIRPLGKGDWRRFRHESKITFKTCGIPASTPVADIPVLLRISSDCPSGVNLADIASDGSNLAFASCSDGAWLDCNVDTWGADGGCVWVRIPSLSENTAIKMYWGPKDESDLWTATDTNVWANYTTVLHMNEKADVYGNRVDSTRKCAFVTDDDISTSGGAVGLAARSSSGGSVRVAKGGPWEQAFTSESFTMSLWLKIDKTSTQAAGHYPYFAQWASGKGQLGDGFWFGGVWSEPTRQDDGAAIWHGGNRDDEVRTGASKLNDADWPTGSSYGGKWLHYTLTCKNENGIAHTVNYIDGRKVNEIDITITNGKSTLFTAPSAASDLCLVNGSDMKSVVTLMDEFRLSKGVRSPAEVAADYQAMVKVDFATFGRIRIASAPNPGLALIIK